MYRFCHCKQLSVANLCKDGRRKSTGARRHVVAVFGSGALAETRCKAIARGAVGLLTKPNDFALRRHEIDTGLGQAA